MVLCRGNQQILYILYSVSNYGRHLNGGHRGHVRVVFDLQLPMQSMHITTEAVSSNPAQASYTRDNIM